MDQDRQQELARVRMIFDEVIQLPPEKRAEMLAARCGPDAELHRRLEAMIATAEGEESFLSSPTRSRIAAGIPGSAAAGAEELVTERAGSSIGPYKLLQEIGEGGFGVVFMAEQDEPVRRRVALKIIKLGMDTRQVVARFEQERQALALMDHPHIAKVLDAGTTPLTDQGGGRSYFVMEYVKGDPITAFADAHKLSVHDRLALFAQVCAAVQHAHTKGVIHRDLKPSNVLVSMTDGRPFAKVIDFGIAKATGARLTDKTLFTEHRQLIGTPEYMSPEQAEGSPDIDTRTDVYSLGVLLYELLTGVTPFDGARLRSAAWGEMQRIIKEEDPPMPSVRLIRELGSLAATASARAVEPARLSGLVHGELDWIVMKALDKDRARRYESPNQLAADVQRHLAGEAVVAAPASAGYRLRKFVRRNKGPVMAGSAVAAALVVGMAGTVWGLLSARTANREMKAQDKAAQAQLTAVMSEAADLGLPVGGGRYEIPGYGSLEIRRRREGEGGPSITVQSTDPKGVVNQGRLPIMMLASETRTVMRDLVDRTRELDAANTRLREQTDVAEQAAYTANLALAQPAMDAGNWPEARRYLDLCPESKRGWEWRFLHNKGSQVAHAFNAAPAGLYAVVTNDGHYILTPVSSDRAAVWDASTTPPTLVGERRADLAGASSASFDKDRRRLLVSNNKGAVLYGSTDNGEGFPLRTSTGYGYTFDAVFSPDGRWIATGTNQDGERVGLWNATSAQPVLAHKLDSGQQWMETVTFSPDGHLLVAAGGDGSAVIWNIQGEQPREVARLPVGADHISKAVFSPDGSKLIIAGYHRSVATVWSISDAPVRLAELSGHQWGVETLAISPDGTRILTASFDGTVRLWDMRGTCLGLYAMPDQSSETWLGDASKSTDFDNSTMTCGFTPDGSSVLVSFNESAWLLDVATFDGGERRYAAGPLTSLRMSVEFGVEASATTEVLTPDGSRRMTGGADHLVRFVDVKTGRELGVVRVPDAVTELRLDVTGERMMIGLANGTALIWDVRPAADRAASAAAESAEREPASQYLDGLLAGPTPTASLREVIIADRSLAPLRRLVAAEMLADRLTELDAAADRAMTELTKGQTDAAEVRAAADRVDASPRIKEIVIARAAAWEYRAPEWSVTQKLAEQTRQTDLARTDVLYERFSRHWELPFEPDRAEARQQLDAVIETRTDLLGPGHLDTAKAIWARGMAAGPGEDPESWMERAAAQLEQAGNEPDAFLIRKYAERVGLYCRESRTDTALHWIERLERTATKARESGDTHTIDQIIGWLHNSDPGGEWSSGAGPGLPKDILERWAAGRAAITRAQLVECFVHQTMQAFAGWTSMWPELREQKRAENAASWRGLLDRLHADLAQSADDPHALAACAAIEHALGDPGKALELARRSEAARSKVGLGPSVDNVVTMAFALWDRGEHAEARAELARLGDLVQREGDGSPHRWILSRAEELMKKAEPAASPAAPQ